MAKKHDAAAFKADLAGNSGSKSDAVQVAVRVRPLSTSEEAQGSESCVDVIDSSILLAEKQHDFDAAFPAATQQENVYNLLVTPLIDQFFDGYNATVFAYGQTGSGKTYTMGNEFTTSVASTERGVIPRVIQNVFDRVNASANSQHYVIKLSYLEVLNEEIHDLLVKSSSDTSHPVSTGLSVRGDGNRGIVVVGLSEHVVTSKDEAGAVLQAGVLARATASTSMNAHSSRSHAICTLIMEHYEVSSLEGGTETRFSKFHLVDLAGSERVRRTNSEGARFKEGVNINRGLLTLGNVINALCDRDRTNSTAHIPYRDSKLTRLLQDSLGGNSKTVMIACISPADVNCEETSNTLRYALRARNIENHTVINKERSAENEVIYLKQQLEIVQLQLLQQTQDFPNAPVRIDVNYSTSGMKGNNLEEENRKLKEELILANSDKAKWKKIADDASRNKRITEESKLNSNKLPHVSTPIKKCITGAGSHKDKDDRGSKSGQLSRLELLRNYQSQKLTSSLAKGNSVKRKVDCMTANKRGRALMSPSPNTSDVGKRSLISKRVSVPPTQSDVQSMETIRKLLQQMMTSQQTIYSAKDAIRMNVADRKELAFEISRLKTSSSSDNAEKLTMLQNDLRTKTANIRFLQQKLINVEKNASLPLGLFPTKVDPCHELIRYLIETLMEAKEESLGLANCRAELDIANEKILTNRKSYTKKTLANEAKLTEVMQELQVLREQTTKKKTAKKRKARESYETMETLFSSSDEDEDDNAIDPDYVDDEHRRKKNTKKTRIILDNADVMDEIDELLETSTATCCSCHGKCATKACACKSQNRGCSKECSCSLSKCQNRCSGGSDTPTTSLSEEIADLAKRTPIPSNGATEFMELDAVVADASSPVVMVDLMSP